MSKSKVILPENYDPYNMGLKRLFHVKADKLNVIGQPRGFPQLLCGAMKHGCPCKKVAGSGTKHTGYGRCNMHGGASTGPKTPGGRAIVSQNSRKHGFYSDVLTPKEYDIFKQIIGDTSVTLEIILLKSKILNYLTKYADKWQRAYEEKKHLGELKAEGAADTEIWKNDTIYNGVTKTSRSYGYHIGTIEDKVLAHALEALGRLIDVYIKLNDLKNSENIDDFLEMINNELETASYGQISVKLE